VTVYKKANTWTANSRRSKQERDS